ncbi:unnamed protein product [Medioppia subpectinata]|uniref:Uncharacterized protein n=1 Tax=Medioppia subpectinata TaxID=1979941 RepID=A0A7R9LXW1_9ACAR|nr:unnamed protein product [Medioppia subpectinata]CAG2122688.1 unnamed protein product [Medioppia subpectinata]
MTTETTSFQIISKRLPKMGSNLKTRLRLKSEPLIWRKE